MRQLARYRLTYLWQSVTLLLLCASVATAERVILKDGREILGRFTPLPSVATDLLSASAENPAGMPILLCDDELRRTMIPRRMVAKVEPGISLMGQEKIPVAQHVAEAAPRIQSIGTPMAQTPFDEFGRRIITLNTPKGPIDVVQGITLITPEYIKVEGVSGERGYTLDQRISTNSVPRETLNKILAKQIDRTNIDHRLRLVKLYIQSQRYDDAKTELQQVLADFPQEEQLGDIVRDLNQQSGRKILGEIEVRRKAGQHRYVYNLLNNFPTENTSGALQAEVRQLIEQYNGLNERGKEAIAALDSLGKAASDPRAKDAADLIRDEMRKELFVGTLPRLAAYRSLKDDPKMSADQKLALLISGWLVGADDATDNIQTARALIDVRATANRFLLEPDKARRDTMLSDIGSRKGVSPQMVAALLRHMKPPVVTQPQAKPGFYELEIPGRVGDEKIRYLVQLPPEYDPNVPYPVVMTLQAEFTTPEQQVDWWAGTADAQGVRQGQAGRYGYIVIAPQWRGAQQRQYEFSAREHAVVLSTLRDACRRFNIDTDRVFLSGHSAGGDAAWDIGLAHPDLWAGIIPITARADKYVSLYWPNASRLPFYFVGGELDGGALKQNAMDYDRYFKQPRDFDITFVEYKGRGHENFSDEILRIFDWMGRKRRDFALRDFNVAAMRPWDNYFWWVEIKKMPERTVVEPTEWSRARTVRPLKIRGIAQNNTLNVTAPAGETIVWLGPDFIDFSKPVTVTANGATLVSGRVIQPSIATMLEDARGRADRQHPFWAKIEKSK